MLCFWCFLFSRQPHKVFVHRGNSDVIVVNVFITVINAMVADTAMMAATNGIVVCSFDLNIEFIVYAVLCTTNQC